MAHKHKAVRETTIGYRGPVGPHWRQNQQAHGGVCFVERCSCGAVRHTNSNGNATESSGWVVEEAAP